MSKLYKQYEELKNQNHEPFYLFRVGIFYLFLDEDAKRISEIFSFKCTPLNESVVKCGFPSSALEKYIKLFEEKKLNVIIIDKEMIINNINYAQDRKIIKLLDKIKKEDINKINGIKALNLINELKELL